MPAFTNLGDEPGKVSRKAKGGRVGLATGGNSSMSDEGAKESRIKANVYNAEGSPEMKEATNETPSFSKGGRKRKDGGSAEDHLAERRMDKHARRASGGATRTPYSSGSVLNAPTDDRPGRGYEGGKPA